MLFISNLVKSDLIVITLTFLQKLNLNPSKLNWLREQYNAYIRAGMHNIRPAGQMCPEEALYLAREAQNLVSLAFS
jgi:hypothetical protein